MKCVLSSLNNPSHFILTGDSNQIVHSNFFSWSKIKTYFYHSGEGKEKDNPIKILRTNYRNSLNVIELSNNLLKIKKVRFGSIDRESNYLVDTVSSDKGEVLLFDNDDKKKQELNRRTQNSAKYLGYEYLSHEELEIVRERALNPELKEAEVKRERKQLFSYAVHHHQYDWIEALACLQFQRAILFMKELRADRKEYEKNVRLGVKQKALAITQKYGVDFTIEDDVTGLMMALKYGQSDIVTNLISQGALPTFLDKSQRLAADYLIDSYLKNKRSKQKQAQMADEQTMTRCWGKIRPQALVYDFDDRQFRVGFHSMLFFLIVLMRNNTDTSYSLINKDETLPKIPVFTMDDIVALVSLIPDEILPPYRKKKSYLNSIMALNEVSKNSQNNKAAFQRITRGKYMLNGGMVFKLL